MDISPPCLDVGLVDLDQADGVGGARGDAQGEEGVEVVGPEGAQLVGGFICG
jgi:hypothetical protein